MEGVQVNPSGSLPATSFHPAPVHSAPVHVGVHSLPSDHVHLLLSQRMYVHILPCVENASISFHVVSLHRLHLQGLQMHTCLRNLHHCSLVHTCCPVQSPSVQSRPSVVQSLLPLHLLLHLPLNWCIRCTFNVHGGRFMFLLLPWARHVAPRLD